jgi:hypothetical protein
MMTFLHDDVSYGQEAPVNVLAYSSPASPAWRWRIVDYAGETVAESSVTFTTIADAVTAGREHLSRMILDAPYRSTRYLRYR